MVTAYERLIDRLHEHGSKVRTRGDRQAVAQCPSHEDRSPSLSVTRADGQTLLHCHAGCQVDDVLAALGMTRRDLFDNPRGARYDYLDAAGVHVLRTVSRTPDKTFRQSVKDRSVTPLYRLPEVVAAVAAGQRVHLVEGEKDVDNLVALAGVTATTAPQGAANFHLVDVEPLRGADVVAVVDRDAPGDKWAAVVAERVGPVAASLHFMRAKVGKDASDHLAAGLGIDKLEPYAPPADVEPEAEDVAHTSGFDATHPLWEARPVLATIRDHARASGVNPFAVLPVVLARVLGHVPSAVTLPPLGRAARGHASLNTFVALTAWSGGGKGLVSAAAAGAVDVMETFGAQVISAPLGSGEGIVEWFARRGDTKAGEEPVVLLPNAPVLDAPEVDHFGALVSRDGSTLASVLRTAWSGELLGTSNRAQNGNRLTVPAHTYRLALVLGVQPLRASRMLADAAGGTPQRFTWAPTEDATLPDRPVPAPPAVLWKPPRSWPDVDGAGLRPLTIEPDVSTELWRAHVARRRGLVRDDDGHANLVRLKLAAGLAILDGRTHVTGEDWQLSGVLAACSRSTLEHVRAALSEAGRRSNRAKAEAEADRASVLAERDLDRAEAHVLRRLAREPNGMTRGDLRRAAAGRDRENVDAALATLVDERQIVAEPFEYRGQPGTRYRLAPGVDNGRRGQAVDKHSTPITAGHSGGSVVDTTPTPHRENQASTPTEPPETTPPEPSAADTPKWAGWGELFAAETSGAQR